MLLSTNQWGAAGAELGGLRRIHKQAGHKENQDYTRDCKKEEKMLTGVQGQGIFKDRSWIHKLIEDEDTETYS